MIEWPARENLTEAAKRNLDLFEGTSAAIELNEDAAKWRLVAWARNEEPPMRMMLRNEQTLEELTFTREESGSWILRRKT
jgi:hypothetical protein